MITGFIVDSSSGVDAIDAIDATDTATIGGVAAASTTDKPKWHILEPTETSVLPITLEIPSVPNPSPWAT